MVESAVGGTVIKGVIDRVLPSGLDWIWTKLKGKTIIVLGPPRVGKTSFFDYFQYGILLEEHPTEKTVDYDHRPDFILRLGKNGALVLRVHSPGDAPGQASPKSQIEYLLRYNPDCAVVVLDASSPIKGDILVSSITWLEEFCQQLGQELRQLKKLGKLRSLIVIMNKWDKVRDRPRNASSFEAAVKNVIDLNAKVLSTRKHGRRIIEIRKCCSVRDTLDTSLIDDILATIALDMTRRQN